MGVVSRERAVKLLKRSCETTIRAINQVNDNCDKEEDEAYREVFKALTGDKPTQQEVDLIFDVTE